MSNVERGISPADAKAMREKSGKRLMDVAFRACCAPSTVRNFELGASVRPRIFERLCAAYFLVCSDTPQDPAKEETTPEEEPASITQLDADGNLSPDSARAMRKKARKRILDIAIRASCGISTVSNFEAGLVLRPDVRSRLRAAYFLVCTGKRVQVPVKKYDATGAPLNVQLTSPVSRMKRDPSVKAMRDLILKAIKNMPMSPAYEEAWKRKARNILSKP